jgi:hypothetical protein
MGTNKPNAEQAAFAVNAMNSGLSKRELIAAMAMQGILANQWCMNHFEGKMSTIGVAEVAEQSLLYTDALIERLNK